MTTYPLSKSLVCNLIYGSSSARSAIQTKHLKTLRIDFSCSKLEDFHDFRCARAYPGPVLCLWRDPELVPLSAACLRQRFSALGAPGRAQPGVRGRSLSESCRRAVRAQGRATGIVHTQDCHEAVSYYLITYWSSVGIGSGTPHSLENPLVVLIPARRAGKILGFCSKENRFSP